MDLLDDMTQPFDELIAILVIIVYLPATDAANNDMLQGAWCVDSVLTRHVTSLS